MLSPDTLIHNRYRVVRQIGQGGIGAVYESIDTRLGNTVALKQTLVGNEELLQAFKREAQLLAGLRHPVLPRVIDYFVDDAGQFLVMDFIAGDDLAARLEQQSAPLPLNEVLDWAEHLLDALQFLHQRAEPIIHRDIKPQNLKVTPEGQIFLLDFGLAKGRTSAAEVDSLKSVYGYTPRYAPLEQIRGKGTDARSDLYALGATLYHLLSNTLPPNALERAGAVWGKEADPLIPLHGLAPHVPVGISAIIMRMLALDVSERPSSAIEARTALRTARAALDAPTVANPTVSMPAPVSPPRQKPVQEQHVGQVLPEKGRRNWLAAGGIVAVLVLIALVGLGSMGLWSSGDGAPTPTEQRTTAQITSLAVVSGVTATAELASTPTAPPTPTQLPTATPPPPPTPTPVPTDIPPPLDGFRSGQQVVVYPNPQLLWDAPFGGSPVLERPRLYAGAGVTILELASDAVQVRTPEGVEGWVHAAPAEALNADTSLVGRQAAFTPGTQVQVVLGVGIPLRSEPRSSADELGDKMPQGTVSTVLELRGDWLYLQLADGTTGWGRWYYDLDVYIDVLN